MALCWSASAADLKIGVASEVTTLDPHFFHLGSNTEIDKLVYSGLITQDADLKVFPDLAVSWRTLDDTHWEFKLREGVKFHDGTPLTADDVVFTYQRARNVPNSPANFLQFLKHVAKTTAVDDHTLVIETDQPDPILLNEIRNVWIVSRKHGEKATTADYNSGKAAIGTGPYREVEWVPGDRIVLERFDGYFGDKPEWQRVTFKPITSDASRIAALLSGDVDLISNVPGNDAVALKDNPKITLGTMASNRCYFWTLDVDRDASPQLTDIDGKPLTRNPLKDVRVRRAMAMAIDRDALVSRVMQGQAVAAAQFMPNGIPGTSPKLKPVAYDLAGAKKLLAEAGGVRVRADDQLEQRSLSERRAGQPGGGADVEPAGAEDHGECHAEGGVFPACCQVGIFRAAERQFHRHRRADVATALPSRHLQRGEGNRRRQQRALFQFAARRRSWPKRRSRWMTRSALSCWRRRSNLPSARRSR